MDKYKSLDRLQALADAMRMEFRKKRDRYNDSIVPQGIWVSLEDAVWLTKAFRKKLRSGSTLDQALGLTGSAGRNRASSNEKICQTWVRLGYPQELTAATAQTIADEACMRYPNTFSESPTPRQVRNAIRTSEGNLTLEAGEALAQALTEKMNRPGTCRHLRASNLRPNRRCHESKTISRRIQDRGGPPDR